MLAASRSIFITPDWWRCLKQWHCCLFLGDYSFLKCSSSKKSWWHVMSWRIWPDRKVRSVDYKSLEREIYYHPMLVMDAPTTWCVNRTMCVCVCMVICLFDQSELPFQWNAEKGISPPLLVNACSLYEPVNNSHIWGACSSFWQIPDCAYRTQTAKKDKMYRINLGF